MNPICKYAPLWTSFRSALLIIFLVAGLNACGPQQPHGYTGNLYFSQGNYLTRFSLRDGSISVVANFGDMNIREISSFGEDRLFLAGTAAIGRRTTARISWIDLDTGEKVSQYSGILARYLANANVVVYDDGIKLYAMPQGSNGGPDEIIYSHGLNQITTIHEVSDNILLFETGDSGERVIRAWDAVTGSQRMLEGLTETCELVGAVWLDSLQQLACQPRNDGGQEYKYLLADLDGNIIGQLKLPEGERFKALTYIPGQDALVLKETWSSLIGNQEKAALWIHDVATGENIRIANNKNLGNSVVFRDL